MGPFSVRKRVIGTRGGGWSAADAAAAAAAAAAEDARPKKPKPTLMTLPREVRDVIFSYVAHAHDERTRLVAHERGAVFKIMKNNNKDTRWHAKRAKWIARMSRLSRHRAERVRYHQEKARSGPNVVVFPSFPRLYTGWNGALLASRALYGEMQDAILRTNSIITRPSVNLNDLTKASANPAKLTWTLNPTEQKILHNARNLCIPLNHTLEVQAMAQVLLQRPEQNIRKLEIRFLGASEEEFSALQSDKGLPHRYWEKLESALQHLSKIPAESVSFTCLRFSPAVRQVYKNSGRKLERRAMLGGNLADLHPRIKELCTPVGKAMEQLARINAQRGQQRSVVQPSRKRARDDAEEEADAGLEGQSTRPETSEDENARRSTKRARLLPASSMKTPPELPSIFGSEDSASDGIENGATTGHRHDVATSQHRPLRPRGILEDGRPNLNAASEHAADDSVFQQATSAPTSKRPSPSIA